jgi:hypothetical protein
MYVFGTIVKNQMAVAIWFISRSSILLHWFTCLFWGQYHDVFVTMDLWYSLKSF